MQALAWHPTEAACLLSGGFDKRACVSDLRTTEQAVAAWHCGADVESLAWDPHQPTNFVVSTERGEVLCYDTRRGAGAEALFTLAAHAKAVTSLALNPLAPGLLVTGSVDKTVRRRARAQVGSAQRACHGCANFAAGIPCTCLGLLALSHRSPVGAEVQASSGAMPCR